MAARLSAERTAEQLQRAGLEDNKRRAVEAGALLWFFRGRQQQSWLQHQLAAQAEAHAVSSRWLESRTKGGRAFVPQLERRAAWEAAQAFNETRRSEIAALHPRVKRALYLRWDTAGDRRVCDACMDMDGHIVRASVGFKTPAPLHAKCRCTETIITATEM